MQIFQEQKPVQQQRPQMYAAVEILQLDVCQLQSYISTALLENPTLECGAAPAVSLLDDLPAGRRGNGEDVEGLPQPDLADKDAVAYGEDLTTHLLFQAERLSLEPTMQRAVFAVIHALDPDGYLRADLSSFGPAPIFDAAVQIVQRLDPPGVGARTLSECLCLQLRALGESGLPCRIAERYLEQAGHHAFAAIAASGQVPLAAVQEAYRQIQCLSPYPCAEFCRASDDSYVIPDVLIHEKDGVLSVSVNKAYTPELTVSSFYRSLGHESEDPEVRQYLAKKVSQAEWLIHCIRQREQTLLRCCQEILKRQMPYFLSRQPLAPMTMQDIVQAVGLHASTVSRALSGKYIQTPQGIRLLRSLFSAKLSGGEVSGVMAQRAIAALVRKEDKRAPRRPVRRTQPQSGSSTRAAAQAAAARLFLPVRHSPRKISPYTPRHTPARASRPLRIPAAASLSRHRR